MIIGLVKRYGKPALIEMWDERIFYFILKFEFNFVDSSDKASALSTDQIDIENGERYDITFTDKDLSYKEIKTTSWTLLIPFIFRGTNYLGSPKSIKNVRYWTKRVRCK